MKTMFPALRAAKTIDLVLKNVVISKAEDSDHMSCDILLAGKKLGSYVHEGNGGHGNFYLVRSDMEILGVQMRKASMPVMPCDAAQTMQSGPYADSALINLICETSMAKTMKRKCKKNTVIVFTDNKYGEYQAYPYEFTAEAKDAALSKLGSRIAYFVNEDIASLEAL